MMSSLIVRDNHIASFTMKMLDRVTLYLTRDGLLKGKITQTILLHLHIWINNFLSVLARITFSIFLFSLFLILHSLFSWTSSSTTFKTEKERKRKKTREKRQKKKRRNSPLFFLIASLSKNKNSLILLTMLSFSQMTIGCFACAYMHTKITGEK